MKLELAALCASATQKKWVLLIAEAVGVTFNNVVLDACQKSTSRRLASVSTGVTVFTDNKDTTQSVSDALKPGGTFETKAQAEPDFESVGAVTTNNYAPYSPLPYSPGNGVKKFHSYTVKGDEKFSVDRNSAYIDALVGLAATGSDSYLSTTNSSLDAVSNFHVFPFKCAV